MVWLTICMTPPPTSFLNLTSEKSGSMPVVSQSIMKPMVPVGAEHRGLGVAVAVGLADLDHAVPGLAWPACGRRRPACRPCASASLAAWCLRMTRLWASALRA